MNLKSFSLALAAVALACLSSAGYALAQNGYRGYIGPFTGVYANDAYAAINRNVPPGLISLAKEYTNTPKGRLAAYAVGEYLDSPDGRQSARQAARYLESPRFQQRLHQVENFLSGDSYPRQVLMNNISSGANFNFLADSAVGYLNTGQVDLVGDRLLLYQGGVNRPHSYALVSMPNGTMHIKTADGEVAGLVQTSGTTTTISMPTHGYMIPLRTTNWLPGDHKYTLNGH